MKSKIESVTVAFGTFLTALVILAQALLSAKSPAPEKETEDDEPEETAAAKKKRLAAEKAAAEKEAADDDDLLGGDEDGETEKVTIADLKAAGQVLIKAGKADKFKALLKKHDAENLGGLDEDVYPAVLAALKKLAK
jgi:hypothetical protein